MLLRGLLEPDAHLGQLPVALFEFGGANVQLVGSCPQLVLRTRDPSLQSRDLLTPGLNVLLGFTPDLRRLCLCVFEALTKGLGGLLVGLDEFLVGFDELAARLSLDRSGAGLRHAGADQEPGACANEQGDDADDDRSHGFSLSSGRGPSGPSAPVRRVSRGRSRDVVYDGSRAPRFMTSCSADGIRMLTGLAVSVNVGCPLGGLSGRCVGFSTLRP